jgi:cyclophilin family peptidyl-prolyl cis-trans isomerase
MANRTAVIETNKGTIKFELLEEDAPKTTEIFVCWRKKVITTA